MNPVLIAASVVIAAGLAQTADRIPADVREHVAQRVADGYCPGLVVAAVDPGGASYFSQGRLSLESDRPVDEDTVFEIGSITKVFTAVLLADMVERGLVSLDDPVQKHLPAGAKVPAAKDRPINLRDLATHRSGLPRMPDNFEPADPQNPYADYTAERMLDFLAGCELSGDVGAEYAYSNLGAGLLGFALAHRARMSYEQLVLDRVVKPLGMKDTVITLSAGLRPRLAQGYSAGAPVKNWDLDALAGAGALRSTARDMVRFLNANMGLVDSPLAGALQATHKDRNPTTKSDLFIALGWHVWTRHGATIIWHNGGTGGYHSFCGFDPVKKLGVVVLTNSSEDIDDIGLHVMEPKFELKELRKTASVAASALDDYVGFYELAPGTVFTITRDGDQLFAQLTGQDKFPVFPESSNKFFFRVVDAQLTFVRDDDGKVNQLILHQGGDRPAKRIKDYRPPVRVEVPVRPEILAQYVGKYEFAPGMVLDVTLEKGQLGVRLTGQSRLPVYPESETKFFLKVVEAQVTFVKDESGKVASVILHQGGIDQTARRLP